MKKTFLALFIASTAFTTNAADNNGFYISAKGGYSFMKSSKSDTKYKFIDIKDDYDLDSKIKDNYTLGGAIGYDFYNRYSLPIRSEIEFMVRGKNNNETKNLSNDQKHITTMYNKLRLNSLMLNAYYDFKNSTSFTPYIGAGVGLVQLKNTLNMQLTDTQTPNSIQKYTLKATSKNIAWSLSAGVQYAITPNLDVDLSYRYFNAGSYTANYKEDKQEINSKFKIESNDILLSLAYRF